MMNCRFQTVITPVFFIPFIKAFLKMVFLITSRQVLKPAGALRWGRGRAGLARGRGSGTAAAERLEGRSRTPRPRAILVRASGGACAEPGPGCRASANGVDVFWFITWLSSVPQGLRKEMGSWDSSSLSQQETLCLGVSPKCFCTEV